MVDRAIALYGTTAPRPEHVTLRAGPVAAILDNGQLRWIRLGDREVLRGLAFLIRDTGWATANPEMSNVSVEQGDGSFTVSFDAHCPTKDGSIDWSGTITGSADGTVVFDAKATPKADFRTNRTGFVILHPLAGVVGQPVKVTYTDGRTEDSHFPDRIDPYQTFKHIRALSHEVFPGIWATCRMDGDTWEIEDHRNWTDASYKTYVKLLEWGYPYTIKGGETVHQTVTLSFSGDVSRVESSAGPAPVALTLGRDAPERLPQIGISLPADRLDAAQAAAPLLRTLRPGFAHCMMDPAQADLASLAANYKKAASSLGAPIVLQVNITDAAGARAGMEAVNAALAEAGVVPEAVAVVAGMPIIQSDPTDSKDEATIAAIPDHARAVFGDDVTIGGGVFGFFTELNRNCPPTDRLDFLAHMTSALIHAADDEAVMETLEAFPYIARSFQALTGGKPHWLGPCNMAMDVNPYGALFPNKENIRTTMAKMEPRQRGLFGAAWTVGLVAEAAAAGIDRLTTSAPAGELGLVYARTDYQQPWFDTSGGMAVYPLYHVVHGALAGAGQRNLAVASSDPTIVRAFGYQANGARVLWLGNQTGRPQSVRLPDAFAAGARLTVVDAATFEDAAGDPDYVLNAATDHAGAEITLDAYAVAQLTTRG